MCRSYFGMNCPLCCHLGLMYSRVDAWPAPTELAKKKYNSIRFNYGLRLCVFYFTSASIVLLTTYILNYIANTPTPIGINFNQFTSFQFHVPVKVLLLANAVLYTSNTTTIDETLSLSELLYQECADDA
ncbi:hypothetical protein THRCLA_09972, partial [Thraustotheca clavata]